MAVTAPRPALPVKLHDDNGNLSCVIANIRYMFGLDDEPDPAKVDAMTGRAPGQFPDPAMGFLYLLREGFHLHSVGPFDPRRFVREGRDYQREFYGEMWDDAWANYFTPERVAWWQRVVAEQEKLFSAHPNYREEIRPVTVDDVAALTTPGQVVCFDGRAAQEFEAAPALVYGTGDVGLWVYCPHTFGVTNCEITHRRLADEFLPEEGIVAISRP